MANTQTFVVHGENFSKTPSVPVNAVDLAQPILLELAKQSSEIPSVPVSVADPAQAIFLKLAEQGGYTAFFLSFSVFVWTVTRFVKAVRED